MPLPMIADTFRCAIVSHISGVLDGVVNVVHIRGDGSQAEDDINGFLQPRWATLISPIVVNDLVNDHVTITKLDGSSSVDFPWTASQPDNTNPSLPMNVALCIGWRTNLAGRSHRGRNYLGPLGNDTVDSATPDLLGSGLASTMDGRGDAMVAGLIADGVALVVASYLNSSAEDVARTKTNPRVCTQRKRVNGK
jgi:hypothetical protein